MISVFFEEIDVLSEIEYISFSNWISKSVIFEAKSLGAISFIFCSDEYLLEMNRTHLNHDFYTDIITFDYCVDDVISGDLFISVDRVKENALNLSIEFVDELNRVCIHGILHLCGYKDKSPEDVFIMRNKEDFMLAHR